IGVVGVAPGANMFGVKVLDDEGNGTTRELLCGIDWVTTTRTDSDPRNDIDVANLSLGGVGTDDGHCGEADGDILHQAIGTSFAAPHVAGAAALWISKHRGATPAQVRQALIDAGNYNWNNMDDPDGIKEPLVDVSSF